MRSRFLRTTSVLVPFVLLGWGAPSGVRAQDAAARADALVLPSPPPAAVSVEDVTETARTLEASVPATLPLDPASPAMRVDPVPPATLVDDRQPGRAADVTGSTVSVGARAAAAGQAGSAPPLDSPVALPPATAGDRQGLTAADLWGALPGFVNGRVAGESPAQAAERRKVREDVATFYAAHAEGPLWIAGDHLSGAARALMGRLDHAAEDGLDLRGYAVPVPRDGDAASLARAELALSEAAVAYARQATGSRVDPAKLGGLIDAKPTVADADAVLGTLPAEANPDEALRAFNPPQPGYAALRDKLAELRRSTPDVQARIPYGPMLKPGMSDARVPLIRARFGLDAGDGTADDRLYDDRVAAAVADFQHAHHMPASGLLTRRTVAALGGGAPVGDPARLEAPVIANMEEWRWLPRDLGADHIEVNIPEFAVRVLRDGAVTHQARVVVGKPDHPTPVFSQVMRFIIVNPYWNVPLSIIKKEMMPKLAADPTYFADHGYEVVEKDGQTYVRQPPGDGNALGRIKFMFPNAHSVYLHDTNAKVLFGREDRALSHGCVRVDQPFDFAEAVLGGKWTAERVEGLVGGDERTVMLPHPLPIHILYFTAFVDPETGFQTRGDVYGYMDKVEAALGLKG